MYGDVLPTIDLHCAHGVGGVTIRTRMRARISTMPIVGGVAQERI